MTYRAEVRAGVDDGPIREPYIAYQQGSLTYEYGKIALTMVVGDLLK